MWGRNSPIKPSTGNSVPTRDHVRTVESLKYSFSALPLTRKVHCYYMCTYDELCICMHGRLLVMKTFTPPLSTKTVVTTVYKGMNDTDVHSTGKENYGVLFHRNLLLSIASTHKKVSVGRSKVQKVSYPLAHPFLGLVLITSLAAKP